MKNNLKKICAICSKKIFCLNLCQNNFYTGKYSPNRKEALFWAFATVFSQAEATFAASARALLTAFLLFFKKCGFLGVFSLVFFPSPRQKYGQKSGLTSAFFVLKRLVFLTFLLRFSAVFSGFFASVFLDFFDVFGALLPPERMFFTVFPSQNTTFLSTFSFVFPS